ncbi:MAG: glycosyltransferase involved in cell wall biosynthesis [Francisella sp.]|jgi:glycosyltransferase involved in cell wall biosynthesis
MNKPLVSVFVLTYNADKYIEECLDSVISQTYDNLQIIVSDDLSSDNTRNILIKYKKKYPQIELYLQDINLGITGNCNFCLDKSKGEYYCFFAGDDVMMPERLEKQVEFMHNNIQYSTCGTACIIIDEESMEKYKINSSKRVYDFKSMLKKGNALVPVPSYMVRRSMVKNNFDSRMSVASDALFYFKVALNGKIYILDEYLTKYRKHYSAAQKLGYSGDTLITYAIIESEMPHLYKYIKYAKNTWYVNMVLASLKNKNIRLVTTYCMSAIRQAPFLFLTHMSYRVMLRVNLKIKRNK